MKRSLLLVAFLTAFVVSGSAQMFTSETARRAGEKFRQGDRAGAIAVLDEAIRKTKDLLEAYQFRGNLRGMTGDLDGAIADYTSVLELTPNDATIYQKRPQYRMFKRDYAGALKDYDLAIANGSKTERNYVGRASIKRDLGDLDGAVVDLQTALAINPNLAAAYIPLSFIYEQRGDLDAAILSLQDFLDRYEGKRDGKLPTAPSSDGSVNLTIKREGTEKDGSQTFMIGSGMTTFNASNQEDVDKQTAKMEQKMNVSLAYITLGRFYAKKGDLDAAILNYDKGLSIKEDDPLGYKQRSDARIKKGDLAGAIADLTKVTKLPMQLPDKHFDRGILFTLQGRDADAEKEFELHLKQFPTATREKLNPRIEEAKKLRGEQALK